MMKRLHRAAYVVLGTLATACTETAPTEAAKKKDEVAPDPNAQTVVLTCEASKSRLSISCAEPQLARAKGGPAFDILYGGQNTFVTLTSSNVAYNSGTGRFTFDLSVKNLLQQPIGTTDGSTLAPTGIRVFFTSGPTVTGGTGVASVVPDGFGTFTGGGQPFYQYNQVLNQNQTSSTKAWTFIIAPTVDTFNFLLLISAPVQYQTGYIEINGQMPGASFGNLHPGTATPLTAVVKNQLGIVIPGAVVTWGTTNANQISVDPAGVATGVRYGNPAITATSGGLNGSMMFNVTGTVRSWNGSVSTDWENGANWNGGYTPALVDTASVLGSPTNQPALTAAVSTGAIVVADALAINLGAFNMTLSEHATTGQGSGGVVGTTGKLILAGPAGTLGGRFSLVEITGIYAQSADVRVTAPITILSGLLRSPSFLTWVIAQ